MTDLEKMQLEWQIKDLMAQFAIIDVLKKQIETVRTNAQEHIMAMREEMIQLRQEHRAMIEEIKRHDGM